MTSNHESTVPPPRTLELNPVTLPQIHNTESVPKPKNTIFYSLIFLVCFLFVAVFRNNFNNVNLTVNLWAASLNTGFFTLPATAISVAFDTVALIIVTLAITGVLFVLHRRRYSFLLLGAMAGEALLVDVCKIIIGSARPLNEIITETNFSFPSGHVSGTVVLIGILLYLTWKHWKNSKINILTGTLYAFVTAIVSFDRIYLNVHWFSDIVGGVFLGAFWLLFCIYLLNRLNVPQKCPLTRLNLNSNEEKNVKN